MAARGVMSKDETAQAAHEGSNPEFVTIPIWCRRVGCSLDSGYRAARRNEIPGQFRIGWLVRVNWEAFVRATWPSATR